MESLGNLDARAAASLLTAASDIALVIDAKGVIRDLSLGGNAISWEECCDWLGQPWQETVTIESRPKIANLLRDAGKKEPQWRQVNHPLGAGDDLPVLYSALRIGENGTVVALGRNLRDVATLQQRLVEAQQSVEREYARLRSAETRYRLLFQVTREPVLIVDSGARQVIEANPAAEKLFIREPRKPARKLVGSAFGEVLRGFDAAGRKSIESLMNSVQAVGRGDDLRVQAQDGAEYLLTVTLFRQESTSFFLLRFAALAGQGAEASLSASRSRLLDVMDAAPDAFVMTRPDGHILTANRAFLDIAQLATEEQARDQPLDRWLGRPGVDWSVLRANLREHQSIRLFASTLQGAHGAVSEIEISAVSVPDGELPCYGFMIRNVGQRLKGDGAGGKALPQSVEQLTELVGRVSLKEIVRETTDVIEQLCIEAALKLTGDNRASAAEMLGVSRQSLYVKLRRHGLADVAPEAET